METKTKHRTRIILPIISLVVIVFGVLYFIGLYKIEGMTKEIVVLEEEVNQINTEGSEIRKQTAILQDILPAQGLLGKYFINKDNIVSFVEHIEEIGEKANVVIKHSNNLTSDSIKFILVFEGEFNDCMYFMALIESLPYNLVVENVFIAKTHNELWNGSMSVNFLGSGRD